MTSDITVRPARESDLNHLVVLEDAVWSRLGSLPLTRDDLLIWYRLNSPFFLVAEKDGNICGYYFGKRISFDLEDRARFLDPANATGHGSIAYEHEPDGKSLYGISITAIDGAGPALYAAVRNLMIGLNTRYSVNYTRLSGLKEYIDSLGYHPYELADIVLWYAHENARKLRLRTWDECVPKPHLVLPPLRRADPVLAFHTRRTTFGILGILGDYIVPDPESLNYGVVILSETPHTTH